MTKFNTNPLLQLAKLFVCIFMLAYGTCCSKDSDADRISPKRAEDFKIVLQAENLWRETGIVLRQADKIEIAAKGTWSHGNDGGHRPFYGPEGFDKLDGNALMPRANVGMLIGKIASGLPFRIGTQTEFLCEKRGKLYLSMNDVPSSFTDNQGSLEVTVSVKSQELAPLWGYNPNQKLSEFLDKEQMTLGGDADDAPKKFGASFEDVHYCLILTDSVKCLRNPDVPQQRHNDNRNRNTGFSTVAVDMQNQTIVGVEKCIFATEGPIDSGQVVSDFISKYAAKHGVGTAECQLLHHGKYVEVTVSVDDNRVLASLVDNTSRILNQLNQKAEETRNAGKAKSAF